MTTTRGPGIPLSDDTLSPIPPQSEEITTPKVETDWIVEEGVIDPEMPDAVDIVALETFNKHVAKTKKKSRSPAPKHCEINHIPDDIGKYLVDLLPSMKVVIANSSFLPFNHADIDLIVNNLVVYLFDNDKNGTPRWRLYNVDREPRPMYHQYILTFAFYAGKDYLSKTGKHAKEIGIQTSERPDGDFATEPGYIHHSQLNRLRPDLDPETPDAGLNNSEMIGYVERARRHLKELELIYSKINPLSWQYFAIQIVDRFMAGESLAIIRTTIGPNGISRTSMNKWWESICRELREVTDENPFLQ